MRYTNDIMKQRLDLAGQRFGTLTVISQGQDFISAGRHYTTWMCKCDCGNEVQILTNNLRRGASQHCSRSCILSPRRQRGKNHKYHPLYPRWINIRQRCFNPKASQYEYYGGRGIKVCREWTNSFESFKDWAEQNGWTKDVYLEIDRIENNGDYEPSNCRWVTKRENSLNQRKKRNNTSGYTGVSKYRNKWGATITITRKTIFLGCYTTALEAAQARDSYIIDNNLQREYKTQTI